jgi:hypothetical protein
MTMGWGEVLLILVSYCASAPNKDQCRFERINCVKKAVAGTPNAADATIIVDACLSAPNAFDHLKPAPMSSGSPVPTVNPKAPKK